MTRKKTKTRREAIPQGIRFDVFRRDNFTCVYCGAKSPDVTLECDHKIAVANGGTDDMENLVTACWDCNRGKGTKSVRHNTKRSAANDNGLVGLFGHSRDENGEINWQFQVAGTVGDIACTIRLFSWMDGRETDVKVVPITELVDDKKYTLYGTKDEWLWRWAKESAERSGRDDRWARGTFYLSTGRQYGEAA